MLRALAVVFVLTPTGCSVWTVRGHLFPTEGPVQAVGDKTKPTLLLTTIDNTAEAVLPNGERCKGKWAYSVTGTATFDAEVSPATKFTTGWPCWAILSCDKGGTLSIDFPVCMGPGRGYGFGKDSDGRTYRALF